VPSFSEAIGSLLASAPPVGQPLEPSGYGRRAKLYLVGALAIISANMAAVWIDARRSAYVPCVENCGETFHVLKYVKDFHRYGTKYGLIELQATDSGPPQTVAKDPTQSPRPLLYTHNPNLPGLLFVLLDAVGVQSLAGKQTLTLLAHGLGLLYGFLAVRLLTRSSLIALVFCGLFATEYEMVFGFALNALRAWHWLALFGLVFHVTRAFNAGKPAGHVAAVSLFATVAMGMGYDFFVVCLAVSIVVAILFASRSRARSVRPSTGAALAVAFLVPLALRQAQIVSVMGFDYWRTDFVCSVLTKVSFLRGFFELPSGAEIERYYATAGVYRPPTTSRSLGETLSLTGQFLRYVTLPTFGIMTLGVSVVLTAAFAFRGFRPPGVEDGGEDAGSAIRAVFSLAVGSMIGMAVFADHNAVIFIKHKVPLIAAPLLLAKAVAIGLLVNDWPNARRSLRRAVLAFGVFLLCGDHFAIQYFNQAATTPYRHTWIDAVRANPNSTYGISWDPTAVSVFADTDAQAVSHRDELAIAQFAARYRGTPAAPRIVSPLLADLPDYWLYFPTDGMSPFDSFSPDCRLDYLSATMLNVLWPAHPAIQPGSWVRPVPAAPGGYVLFGGRIAERPFRNVQLMLRSAVPSGAVTTNCRYQTFAGWIQTFDSQGDGRFVVSLASRNRNYGQLKVDLRYWLAASAPPPDFEHPALLLQLPRPSVDEMRRRLPSVPVAKEGSTWVLFDLRGFKR